MNATTANTHVQEPDAAPAKKDDEVNPRKEKSVLQAKLTKLAIQIGYAGILTLAGTGSRTISSHKYKY